MAVTAKLDKKVPRRWWKRVGPSSTRLQKTATAVKSTTIAPEKEEPSLMVTFLKTTGWNLFVDIVLPVYTVYLALTNIISQFLIGLGFNVKFMQCPDLDPKEKEGYVRLIDENERRYRYLFFNPVSDLWSQPICSVPGATFQLFERRKHHTRYTPILPDKPSINMASYNYLGFAHNTGSIPAGVAGTIREAGLTFASPSRELGVWEGHRQLEKEVAEFLGKEEAILCPMGFATNSMHLPALADKGTLIISDEFNHSSLVMGCRLSGASIKVFKHNDMRHLEKILRRAVIHGHRSKCRKWKKILIIVEGAYSMEGSIVNLPDVVRLKKKYKAYLYVDEAHSIGALGPHGKGVTDLFNIDPKDVDILMGTFTKSFAAFGGYIAGNKEIIDHLRASSHSPAYSQTMSPPVVQQIKMTIACIRGQDGSNEGQLKIQKLRNNAVYTRQKLASIGFHVYGDIDCPIIPIRANCMVFPWISRILQNHGVSIVVVGPPAVPYYEGRIRLCLSADHTREQLDRVIDLIDQIGYLVCAKRYTMESLVEYCRKNAIRRRKGNYIDLSQYAFGGKKLT